MSLEHIQRFAAARMARLKVESPAYYAILNKTVNDDGSLKPEAFQMKVLFRNSHGNQKWSERYNECNDKGEFIHEDFRNTQVGSIYVKRDSEVGKLASEFIEVTIAPFTLKVG